MAVGGAIQGVAASNITSTSAILVWQATFTTSSTQTTTAGRGTVSYKFSTNPETLVASTPALTGGSVYQFNPTGALNVSLSGLSPNTSYGVTFYVRDTTAGTILASYPLSFITPVQLSYNANGGSPTPGTQYFQAGSTAAYTASAPTRSGYTFNYWVGSNGSIYADNVYFTMPSTALTLTASWSPYVFTINYNGNNGTITASGSTTASTATYTSTSQYLATRANGFTVPAGYTFGGWSYSQDNTRDIVAEANYGPFNISSSNQAVTLHAVWNLNSYTATFDPNFGSVTPTSKPVTYNTAYGTLPTPTRANYIFGGWFTALTGGTQVLSTTIYTATANSTIYARWSQANPVFIDTAPYITTTGMLSKNINTNADFTVTASPVTGYSIVSSGTGLNPTTWLSINSSGQLSGAPTAIGTYTFKIRATNSGNNTDTAEISFVVKPSGVIMTGPTTKVALSTAKRFIGIGASTTNAQGATISADANGYVNLSRMMVYKNGAWTNITNT